MEEELKPREIVEKFECRIYSHEMTSEAVSIKDPKYSFEIDNFGEEKKEQIGPSSSNVFESFYRDPIDSLIKSQEDELENASSDLKKAKIEKNIRLLKGTIS